jgi:hypothetical protein
MLLLILHPAILGGFSIASGIAGNILTNNLKMDTLDAILIVILVFLLSIVYSIILKVGSDKNARIIALSAAFVFAAITCLIIFGLSKTEQETSTANTPPSPTQQLDNLMKTPSLIIPTVITPVSTTFTTRTTVPGVTSITTAHTVKNSLPLLQQIFPQAKNAQQEKYIENNGGSDISIQADPICKNSILNNGLLINYEIYGSRNSGWRVYWDNPGFDASAYNTLTFWAKGLAGGEIFGFTLKDTKDNEVNLSPIDFMDRLPTDWVKITIELKKGKTAVINFTSIKAISFTFDSYSKGFICINEIAFK